MRYNVHCTRYLVYEVRCELYNVQCTLYIVVLLAGVRKRLYAHFLGNVCSVANLRWPLHSYTFRTKHSI